LKIDVMNHRDRGDIYQMPTVELWRVPSSGMFTKLVII
jgi:hypothetical protein